MRRKEREIAQSKDQGIGISGHQKSNNRKPPCLRASVVKNIPEAARTAGRACVVKKVLGASQRLVVSPVAKIASFPGGE